MKSKLLMILTLAILSATSVLAGCASTSGEKAAFGCGDQEYRTSGMAFNDPQC